MDSVLSDCFVVYAHWDGVSQENPARIERELAWCGTYEEADQSRHQFEREGVHCVIRFVGPSGGGD
jgi:hypothetical protein